MTYIVKLDVEDGDSAGETRVCGPFHDYDEAGRAADRLSDYGVADTLPLAPTVEEVEGSL